MPKISSYHCYCCYCCQNIILNEVYLQWSHGLHRPIYRQHSLWGKQRKFWVRNTSLLCRWWWCWTPTTRCSMTASASTPCTRQGSNQNQWSLFRIWLITVRTEPRNSLRNLTDLSSITDELCERQPYDCERTSSGWEWPTLCPGLNFSSFCNCAKDETLDSQDSFHFRLPI